MCATWHEDSGTLGDRPDFDAWAGEVTGKLEDRADALVVYDGLGPDDIPAGNTTTDIAWSILVGLTIGVVLLVVLWFVAVWTVKS